MRNKRDFDTMAIFAEARKSLPYTITPIGDQSALNTWKNEQAIKQVEWEARKALRHSTVVQSLQDGTIVNKAEKSETTKKWERYKELKENLDKKFARDSHRLDKYEKPKPKSIFTKIYEFLTA